MKPIFIEEKKSIFLNPKFLFFLFCIFLIGVYNRMTYENIYSKFDVKTYETNLKPATHFIKAIHIRETYIKPLNKLFELDSPLLKPFITLRNNYVKKGRKFLSYEGYQLNHAANTEEELLLKLKKEIHTS